MEYIHKHENSFHLTWDQISLSARCCVISLVSCNNPHDVQVDVAESMTTSTLVMDLSGGTFYTSLEEVMPTAKHSGSWRTPFRLDRGKLSSAHYLQWRWTMTFVSSSDVLSKLILLTFVYNCNSHNRDSWTLPSHPCSTPTGTSTWAGPSTSL